MKPGFLFAALKGVAAHGRDFVAQAKANGAVAVLSADDLGGDPGIAARRRRRTASGVRARRFEVLSPPSGDDRRASPAPTAKARPSISCARFGRMPARRAASLGTLGAIGPNGVIDLGHTTPDPAAVHATLTTLAEEGVTHAAMEASSHGLEQHRVDGVTFAAGAFTNLTQDHLDYHEDMADYRDAKLKLWNLVRDGGAAIINADAAEAIRSNAPQSNAASISFSVAGARRVSMR